MNNNGELLAIIDTLPIEELRLDFAALMSDIITEYGDNAQTPQPQSATPETEVTA